ncbi:hypothetical protein AAFC00_006389 [Neodothiora populina]|uniref:Kynurenine 3-monooxygenase n=1 Tax=Neodothiora populina TaxID=2781224 RepID=A0ABR3P592_9PEZI
MEKQKFVVIGAGPVGALAALYAAGRGFDVEVYELRGDLRDPQVVPLNFTRSINLAMSERGINALKHANIPGLVDSIMTETIPMHGRMIHGVDNGSFTEESQNYDIHGRFISAVDRAGLNKRLLDELDKLPNVKMFFNYKLTGADFRAKRAWFEERSKPLTDHAQNPSEIQDAPPRATEIEVAFDFMLGCDGAHSAVRYHLMKYTRMDYTQSYIDTLWCEFHIDPTPSTAGTSEGDFKISPNHLHIWPGREFMFIAIPSSDKSFTSTLFLPAHHFAHLDANPSELVPFFNRYFPGVAGRLISESDLQKQYTENPHLPLITIKCSPHHYASSAVILGDAAHAMVPFYGQGMNAGLEDVRVLFSFLDAAAPTPEGRTSALAAYSTQRTPDASAICDLALRNYQEMRADVASPIYKFRKWVEEKLSVAVPRLGWATQYSRISFGNQRYSEVERLAQRQGGVLLWSMTGFVGLLATGAVYGAWAWWRWNRAAATSRGLLKGGIGLTAIGERIGRVFL